MNEIVDLNQLSQTIYHPSPRCPPLWVFQIRTVPQQLVGSAYAWILLFDEILFHDADYINLPHLASSEFGVLGIRYVCRSHDRTPLIRRRFEVTFITFHDYVPLWTQMKIIQEIKITHTHKHTAAWGSWCTDCISLTSGTFWPLELP